ncbi:MAG TPA: hypothetical protein ENH99_00405 [Candidatus Pacearchaeota archaeon]|nr:hypothetical protein [Candidatus Pacearchaeota archaeon]
MPTKDTSEVKEKIVSFLRRNGPSLPIRISGEIKENSLFTSAFLSELLSEKRIMISDMKVGSSPLYFIEGHEPMLERFSHHLKSKEKEAFSLIKEKRFLKDSEQEPAIRVAIREIKDFALPFKNNEEIVWRFFTAKEDEFSGKKKLTEEKKIEAPRMIDNEKQEESPEEKQLGIFNEQKKPKTTKSNKKRTSQKENKFFTRVKEFLSENYFELLDIESFSKNEIILRIRKNGMEKVLFAYNKKRVSDNEIIKASKKASELSSKYILLCLGEPLKKVRELIEASKNLDSIEKLK